MPIRYAELARALGVAEGERAPLARVRELVIELRRGKGMVLDASDPDTRSAGSFFTNPILSAADLAKPSEEGDGDGFGHGWLRCRKGGCRHCIDGR